MRHLHRRLLSGQGMVEFALVAPLFFLMLFGTIEMGRLMWTNHELANGTREGARYAMVHGAEAATQATCADVKGQILARTAGLQEGSLGEPLCTGLGGEPGDKIVIETTYQFDFLVGIIPGLETIKLEHRSEVITQH